MTRIVLAACTAYSPSLLRRGSSVQMMADRVFSPEEAKGGAPVQASKTAVLFIEYQNEFATEGGKLYDAVKGTMGDMLDKSVAVAAVARQAGATVMHAPIMFKEDASDNPNKALGILAGCANDKLFTEGTWNAAFCERMAPAAGDVVVQGKKGLDAFPGTDLEASLKARGIETVALAGFLTNCCVESTMRTAYEKGFHVITLTDCCATTDEVGQGVTGGSYGMFSMPMKAADFEAKMALSGDKAAEDKAAEDKEAKKAEKAAKEAAKAKEKLLKTVIKEGGKKGVEIEGASDMGGLDFFCTTIESPDGDLELLQLSMTAMNAQPDPDAEDRKGCSGHVGKMVFSAGTKQLAMVAYVPDAEHNKSADKVDVAAWMDSVCAKVGGTVTVPATAAESPMGGKTVCAVVLSDPDKGKFALKDKDAAMAAAFDFLRSKGAFPEDGDDSDDEMIFGDDDNLDDYERACEGAAARTDGTDAGREAAGGRAWWEEACGAFRWPMPNQLACPLGLRLRHAPGAR